MREDFFCFLRFLLSVELLMILIKLVLSPPGGPGRDQIFIYFSERQSGVGMAAAIFPILEGYFVRAAFAVMIPPEMRAIVKSASAQFYLYFSSKFRFVG